MKPLFILLATLPCITSCAASDSEFQPVDVSSIPILNMARNVPVDNEIHAYLFSGIDDILNRRGGDVVVVATSETSSLAERYISKREKTINDYKAGAFQRSQAGKNITWVMNDKQNYLRRFLYEKNGAIDFDKIGGCATFVVKNVTPTCYITGKYKNIYYEFSLEENILDREPVYFERLIPHLEKLAQP